MKISILTPDSKKPNLVAMKISAWHKANGDKVYLNPEQQCDFTYASILFNFTPIPDADETGGTGYDIQKKLDPEIDKMKPDYDLYPNIDYSLGYTYKACPRSCDFCVVPLQQNDDKHYSIWSFHDSKFKKISLLNNNILADPNWRDTFNEILEAKLKIIDQNGFDARLVTEEVGHYIKRLRFDGYIHSAWDYMEHENEILIGLKILRKSKSRLQCYVLIGNTTPEEDMYRIKKLNEIKVDPYIMPLNKKDPYQKRLARWVNHKAIFRSVKWEDYKY